MYLVIVSKANQNDGWEFNLGPIEHFAYDTLDEAKAKVDSYLEHFAQEYVSAGYEVTNNVAQDADDILYYGDITLEYDTYGVYCYIEVQEL